MMLNNIPLIPTFSGGSDWQIADMARFMCEKEIRHVFIYHDGLPTGVVGLKDIVYKGVAKGHVDLTAKDILSSPIITINSDKTAKDAYFLMIQNNLFSVPVLRDGAIIGELTLNAAFDAMQKKQ